MTAADAIVLAGGRASRMGGVDKPAIVIGGRSMLDAALASVHDCTRVVVVGPHRPELDSRFLQAREVPPGSGPVAAIGSGLSALDATNSWIVVLAADMPFLTEATVIELLREATESTADAVFAIDADGRPQYLVGVWRHSALEAALAGLDSLVNQPMKAIVPAHTALIELPDIADCDTEEEVRLARETLATTRASARLDLTEAREHIASGTTSLAPHEAELADVPGAALAAPITAAGALPRFDVSAMDGYAVCGDGPWQLRRDIGFAGGARPAGLLLGEAVRIATGAHVPDGTTSVLRDEFATITGDELTRLPDTPIRGDVRKSGEDRMIGDLVAPAGTRVTAALRSAAASVEVTTASVRGPVRARIIMTGDEIRSTGPLQTGQTRDSIGPVLPDLLAGCGVRVVDRVHLRDTANSFDDMLTDTEGVDLLVVVGATGGGAADQLRTALARAEARILVPRLALRPGGSTVVAELPTGPTILGLPGNPFAAIAVLLALTPAIVAARTASPLPRTILAPLHNAADITAPVTRITPAQHAPQGGYLGDPTIRTAHLAGLINRDGLVIVPPNATNGDLVEFLPIPS
ncbi:NTP transferase domain-containing protein [Nocardia sp. NPDC058666]|uniref:NTP transferase domain-containing protein n=1 Tax=Nocardia sp. NPDC058666 TaxID=3346587 RepID=UPI003658BB91